MSTLDVEKDLGGEQAPQAVEMIDCGRASERTCGIPLLLLLELATPPNNKLFLFPG